MPKQRQRKKRGQRRRSAARQYSPRQPHESRAAEATTVAWTVTVTAVLFCDIIAVVAHLYVSTFPPAELMVLLERLMLFFGSTIGLICLVLIPILYRVRRVPPPYGIVVFAVLTSLAPMIVLVRAMTL